MAAGHVAIEEPGEPLPSRLLCRHVRHGVASPLLFEGARPCGLARHGAMVAVMAVMAVMAVSWRPDGPVCDLPRPWPTGAQQSAGGETLGRGRRGDGPVRRVGCRRWCEWLSRPWASVASGLNNGSKARAMQRSGRPGGGRLVVGVDVRGATALYVPALTAMRGARNREHCSWGCEILLDFVHCDPRPRRVRAGARLLRGRGTVGRR